MITKKVPQTHVSSFLHWWKHLWRCIWLLPNKTGHGKGKLHQKAFCLQDIKSIMGKLGHIASTALWLPLLLPNLNVWETPPHFGSKILLSLLCSSVVQGKIILWATVQSSTIKNYFNGVCNLFTDKGLPSLHSSKYYFINIIAMLWDYNQVPRHRNLITNKMTLWMATHIAAFQQNTPVHCYLWMDQIWLLCWIPRLWVVPDIPFWQITDLLLAIITTRGIHCSAKIT